MEIITPGVIHANVVRRASRSRWEPLIDAGVEFYEYQGSRFHCKLLIVDGKIGFIGGAGLADIWQGNADAPKHWRDSQFRLEGPAVGQMQAAFMDNWTKTTGRVLDTVDLNAQTYAVPFYAKHDFTVVGDEFMDAGIPHLAMTRRLVRS